MARRRRVRLAWAAGAAIGLGGCGSGSPPVATAPAGVEARARLAERLNASRPPREPARLPAWLSIGLPPASPAINQTETTPLAELLETYQAEPIAEDGAAAAAVEPSESAAMAALRAYTAGRTALLTGETGEAVRQLRRASEYDPASAAVWRALGEAQRAAGLSASAARSFERAVALGLREPLPLLFAALEAQRRSQHERAVRLLARVIDPAALVADEAQLIVAWAAIGDSLAALGRPDAATAAYERGLRLPRRLTRPTQLEAELTELERTRGERRRLSIDLLLESGRPLEALELATEAMELEPYLRPGIPVRLAEAGLRAGRPLRAAAVLVEDAAARREAVPVGTINLIGLLAAELPTQERRLLAAASKQAAVDADPAGPAAAQSWALLAAAIEGTDEVASLLDTPGFEAIGPSDRLVRVAIGIAGDATLAETAGALLSSRPDLAALVGEALAWRSASSARGIALDPRLSPIVRLAAARSVGLTAEALNAARLIADRRDASEGELLAVAIAAAGAGDWPLYERALASLERVSPSPARTRMLTTALWAGQRTFRALETLLTLEQPAAGDLVIASELARQLGDAPRQAELAADAVRIDPSEPTAIDARWTALQRSPRALTTFARTVRDEAPSSDVVRRLLAEQEAGAGNVAAAVGHLRRLFLERPAEDIANGLVGLWRGAGRSATPPPEALDWTRSVFAAKPASPAAAQLRTQTLLAAGRGHDAAAELEEALRVAPRREIARLREAVLRQVGDEPAAEASVRARTDDLWSIDESVERIAAAATASDVSAAPIDRAFDRLPEAAQLTLAQQGVILDVLTAQVQTIAQRAGDVRRLPADIRSAVLATMRGAVAREVPLTSELHRVRLQLMLADEAPSAAIVRAGREAREAFPNHDPSFLVLAAEALIATERPAEAVPLLADALLDEGLEPPDRLVDLVGSPSRIGLIGAAGTAEDLRGLIADLRGAGLLEQASRLVRAESDQYAEGDRPLTGADLAYRVAGHAYFMGRDAESRVFYRVALEEDPGYAWAANDLGYFLLDDLGDVEAAAPLIERAARALPESYNVIDSLGWLRYKQGRLDGDEGAVALLAKAAELSGDEGTGAIWDHYGDALYASGDADAATDAWTRAREIAAAFIAEQNIDPSDDRPFARRLRAVLERANAKVAAVAAGREPEIAPTPAARRSPARTTDRGG